MADLAYSWGEFEQTKGGSKTTTKTAMSSASKARGGGGSWEDLRKEARQLENQIDTKLASFGKLGTNFSKSSSSGSSSSAKTPLLAGDETSNQSAFESLSAELSQLLSRLSEVNDGMTEYAASGQSVAGSAAVHHTLQRHRDILQDYGQEYNKTRANIQAVIEREDLLSSVHRDIDDYRSNVKGPGARMDHLLRESESARNSERLIDEQINIAIESRETLARQRLAFKAMRTKLNDIANRFPLINSLVQKINLKKRKDSVILGAVIGVCLLFMLWWVFG